MTASRTWKVTCDADPDFPFCGVFESRQKAREFKWELDALALTDRKYVCRGKHTVVEA